MLARTPSPNPLSPMRSTATLSAAALSLALAAADPLACQPNDEFPMLPIYHLIGNVTKSGDGSIKLGARAHNMDYSPT